MIRDIDTITDKCGECGKEFQQGDYGYKIIGKYICKVCNKKGAEKPKKGLTPKAETVEKKLVPERKAVTPKKKTYNPFSKK